MAQSRRFKIEGNQQHNKKVERVKIKQERKSKTNVASTMCTETERKSDNDDILTWAVRRSCAIILPHLKHSTLFVAIHSFALDLCWIDIHICTNELAHIRTCVLPNLLVSCLNCNTSEKNSPLRDANADRIDNLVVVFFAVQDFSRLFHTAVNYIAELVTLNKHNARAEEHYSVVWKQKSER